MGAVVVAIITITIKTFKLPCAWLTLILLTWRIRWAPNNASKWQMRFNSALEALSTTPWSMEKRHSSTSESSWTKRSQPEDEVSPFLPDVRTHYATRRKRPEYHHVFAKTCIRTALALNLRRHTSNSPDIRANSKSVKLYLPSKSFPPHSLITIPTDEILATASQNKPQKLPTIT